MLDKSFIIKRSNGDFQTGWTIQTFHNAFIRSIENEWCLPFVNMELGLVKVVPIASFLHEDLKTANSSILTSKICTNLKDLIERLKNGIFKSDYEAQKLVTSKPDSVLESTGVVLIMSSAGPVRALV